MDKKRHMSILKSSAQKVDVNDAEITNKATNKVRFSSNFVKEFTTMEGEYHTIWDNTYEEEIAKSSTHSSFSLASNSSSIQTQAREDEIVKENTRQNCFSPKFGIEKENIPMGKVNKRYQQIEKEPVKVLSVITIQKNTIHQDTNSQLIQFHKTKLEETQRKTILFEISMDETEAGETSSNNKGIKRPLNFNTTVSDGMDLTNVEDSPELQESSTVKSRQTHYFNATLNADMDMTNIVLAAKRNDDRKTILINDSMNETIFNSPVHKKYTPSGTRHTIHFNRSMHEANMDFTNVVSPNQEDGNRIHAFSLPMEETFNDNNASKRRDKWEGAGCKPKSRQTIYFNGAKSNIMDMTCDQALMEQTFLGSSLKNNVVPEEHTDQMEKPLINTTIPCNNRTTKEEEYRKTLFANPMEETILSCASPKMIDCGEKSAFNTKSRCTFYFNTSQDGNMDITNVVPDEFTNHKEKPIEGKSRTTAIYPAPIEEVILESARQKLQGNREKATFKGTSRYTVHFNASNDGNMDITNVAPDECPEHKEKTFTNTTKSIDVNMKEDKNRNTLLFTAPMEETILDSSSSKIEQVSKNSTSTVKSRHTVHFNTSKDGNMDITNAAVEYIDQREKPVENISDNTTSIMKDKNRKTIVFDAPMEETVLSLTLPSEQDAEAKNIFEAKSRFTTHFSSSIDGNLDITNVTAEENIDQKEKPNAPITGNTTSTTEDQNRKTIVFDAPVETILSLTLTSVQDADGKNTAKFGHPIHFNLSNNGNMDTINIAEEEECAEQHPLNNMDSIVNSAISKIQRFDGTSRISTKSGQTVHFNTSHDGDMDFTNYSASLELLDEKGKDGNSILLATAIEESIMHSEPIKTPELSHTKSRQTVHFNAADECEMEITKLTHEQSNLNLINASIEKFDLDKEDKVPIEELFAEEDTKSTTVTKEENGINDRTNLSNQKQTFVPTIVISDFDCNTYNRELMDYSIENMDFPNDDLQNVSASAMEKDNSLNNKNDSDLLKFAAHDPSVQPKHLSLIDLALSYLDKSYVVDKSINLEPFTIPPIEDISSMDIKHFDVPHVNVKSLSLPIHKWFEWTEQERRKKLQELKELESFVVDETILSEKTWLQKAEKLAIRHSAYAFKILSEDSVRLFIHLGEIEMIIHMDPNNGSVVSFDLEVLSLDQKRKAYLKWLDKFFYHIMDTRQIQSCIGEDIGILSLMDYVEYQVAEFQKTFNSVFRSFIWHKATLDNNHKLNYRYLTGKVDLEVKLDLSVFKMEKVVVEPVVHRGHVCKNKLLQIVEAVTKDAYFPFNVLSEIDKYLKASFKPGSF